MRGDRSRGSPSPAHRSTPQHPQPRPFSESEAHIESGCGIVLKHMQERYLTAHNDGSGYVGRDCGSQSPPPRLAWYVEGAWLDLAPKLKRLAAHALEPARPV